MPFSYILARCSFLNTLQIYRIFSTLKSFYVDNLRLMTNISDRIAILIKEKGISTRALEQAIGCSNGVISRCISKGTDISSLWVSKIIEIHNDINPTWLLTGKGDIYYNTSSTTTQTTELSSLLALIREKEEIIREQDREIGRLEERIRQMTIEKEKHVSDAPISGTANVG